MLIGISHRQNPITSARLQAISATWQPYQKYDVFEYNHSFEANNSLQAILEVGKYNRYEDHTLELFIMSSYMH